MRAGLFAGVLSVALIAFASGRKVSLPVSGGYIQLTNGSDTPVSYSMVCYGSGNGLPVGGTNTYTLGARASTSYYYGSGSGTFAGCGSNYAYWTSGDSKAAACGYTSYANHSSMCSAGYTVCGFNEYATAVGTNYYSAWVTPPSGFSAASWSYRTWTGATTWSSFTASDAVSFYPGGQCKDGANNVTSNCAANYASNSMYTACCTASVSVGVGQVQSCDVSVQGSTGFLQSSNWKGNTPF
jgi:hypothetical protein